MSRRCNTALRGEWPPAQLSSGDLRLQLAGHKTAEDIDVVPRHPRIREALLESFAAGAAAKSVNLFHSFDRAFNIVHDIPSDPVIDHFRYRASRECDDR